MDNTYSYTISHSLLNTVKWCYLGQFFNYFNFFKVP